MRKYKILIVENGAESRENLRRLLPPGDQYEIVFLAEKSGQTTIETCLVARPDCVLLGDDPPDTNALDLIAALNPNPFNPSLAIVWLTGTDDESLAVRAIKNGAQNYLVENRTTPEKLSAAINDAILTVRARRKNNQTKRTVSEEALRDSEIKYKTLFDSIDEGFCVVEVLFDGSNAPVDYRFLELNPSFSRLTGISAELALSGKTVLEIIPDLEKRWIEIYGNVALTGESIRFENYSNALKRWFDVNAFRVEGGNRRKVGILFTNTTERKRTEEELRENQLFIQSVIETAPTVFYVHNIKSNRNEFMTAQAAQALGFGKNEIEFFKEDFVQKVMHAEDLARAAEYFAGFETEKNGSVRELEYRMRHKDGSYRWFHSRDRVFKRDDDGAVEKILGVALDITDRKRAEDALLDAERRAAREYQRLLARIAPLAETLGTARELKTIYRAVHKFVQASMPLAGFFVSFYEPEDSRRIAAYAWAEGEELNVEKLPPITLTAGGGPNSRAVYTKKSVVTDGYMEMMANRPHVLVGDDAAPKPQSSIVSPMIVMQRVVGTLEAQAYEPSAYSEEHVVALELAANLAAVAIENARLFNDEATARRQAETANRSKDEFLAVLSHELRTPLNSMLGWTTLLRNGTLDERKSGYALEVIDRNVRLQNALIEDLLDVSRIVTGKMKLEKQRVSLNSVVENAVEAARPSAEAKKISIEMSIAEQKGEIDGDEYRLQQVVANLLSNAVKFTPENGRVNVSLEYNSRSAVITVADDGIGISADLLPHIFDRFRQADATSRRKYDGLGLGLAIARSLIEMHEGEINVVSGGANSGTTFSVTIPLSPSSLENEANSDMKSGDGKTDGKNQLDRLLDRLSVLLVDDHQDTLEMLKQALGDKGATVVSASSAAEALRKLEVKNFDLLISDIGMAEMDGFDLIQKVRRLDVERQRFIPAIALTGYAETGDRDRALSLGFQMFLTKPVDVLLLPEAVKKALDYK